MKKGFTLTETLVVITIVTLVGGVLTYAIFDFYRTNRYVVESVTATDNARRGISGTLRNLREASYGEDGSYPILSASTSSISFFADVDGDPQIERVRWYLSGGTLFRGVVNASGNPPSYTGQPEVTDTLVTFVRNSTSTPLFRYFDESGAEISSPVAVGRIRTVTTEVIVDINPLRAPELFTLTGSATLRNLR